VGKSYKERVTHKERERERERVKIAAPSALSLNKQ